MSTKKALLAWIDTIIPEYNISNFGTDWNDGRALCDTVDHIRPRAFPNHLALASCRGLENCTIGMDLAECLFEIPKILTPEDLNNPDVDDLSVMTYISVTQPISFSSSGSGRRSRSEISRISRPTGMMESTLEL